MKHKDKRKGILLKMIIDVTEIEIKNLNIARNFDIERKRRGKNIYRNRNVEITEVEKKEGKEEYNIKASVDGNYGIYEQRTSLSRS